MLHILTYKTGLLTSSKLFNLKLKLMFLILNFGTSYRHFQCGKCVTIFENCASSGYSGIHLNGLSQHGSIRSS